MKHDLQDTTFVIPDGPYDPIRAENLDTVVRYLNHHFHTNILIVNEQWCLDRKIEPRFAYNKYLNLGFREVSTPYVVSQDGDCIFEVQAYLDARQTLKDNPHCCLSFPFDGWFYSLAGETRKKVIETLSVEGFTLENTEPGNHRGWSHGRPFFAPMDKFREVGFENPNFTHWGFENHERELRVKKFGYSVARHPYICWHLDHPEKVGEFFSQNQQSEKERIGGLLLPQLRAEIEEWDTRWR